MARPRKAAVEGQASPVADIDAEIMAAAEAMKKHPSWTKPGWTRTAEQSAAEDYSHALGEALDYFKENYPDAWDALRLCPLQHGLDDMIAKLKG